jgi:hypothetical protein
LKCPVRRPSSQRFRFAAFAPDPSDPMSQSAAPLTPHGGVSNYKIAAGIIGKRLTYQRVGSQMDA